MNELASLRDLGEALDQELRGPSPRLRHKVITGIGRQPGRATQGLPRRHGPGWRLVVTGGLAVALAGALLIASTFRLWGASPAASAQAASILRRAAFAAGHQPALAARPSQFIFIESVESAAAMTGNGNGRITSVHMSTDLREIWLSAAGTRNGLLREQPRSAANPSRPTGPWQTTVLPGCRDGRPTPVAGAAVPDSPCVPQPAYRQDSPLPPGQCSPTSTGTATARTRPPCRPSSPPAI